MLFDDTSPMPIGAMPDFIVTLTPPSEQCPMNQGRPGAILIMDPAIYHVVRDIVMKKITSEQVQQLMIDGAKAAQQDEAQVIEVEEPKEDGPIPDSTWDGRTW